MLQAGGIDKLVEQKADAYRSNPQALQKRYSQNQELMDLLAMQKLKTEKETAARDMQLKAEQTPSTIAEQYEQQLVGMNKNEMAQQTAGIMGERQKKAQQKQQAMGIPPQQAQQRPPMPQAASQGIASQPRPNLQGMAKGGIIGFDKGGSVPTQAEIDEYRRKAEQSGTNTRGLTDEEIIRVLTLPHFGQPKSRGSQNPRSGRPRPPEETPAAPSAATASGDVAGGYSSELMEKFAKPKPPASGDVPDGYSSGIMEKFAKPKTPTVQAPDGQAPDGQAPTGQAPTGQDSGKASVNKNLASVGLDVDKLSAVPDTSGISRTQVSDSLGEEVTGALKKDVTQDPTAIQTKEIKRMSGADKSVGGLDRAGQEATYNKYLKEQEALDAAQLDPENLKRERRRAGIAGFLEEGTGRGSVMASRKFDTNIAKKRQDNINRRFGMEKERMANDVEVAGKINTEAGLAMGRVMEDRQKAMSTLASISAQDLAMYNTEADRMYEANQNGIKNRIDALKADTAATLNQLIQRQASAAEIANQISSLHDKSTKLRAEWFTSLGPALLELRAKESRGELSVEDAERLAGYEVQFQKLKDKTKLDDALDVMLGFLKQLHAQGSYSVESTDGTTNTGSSAETPNASIIEQTYMAPS